MTHIDIVVGPLSIFSDKNGYSQPSLPNVPAQANDDQKSSGMYDEAIVTRYKDDKDRDGVRGMSDVRNARKW